MKKLHILIAIIASACTSYMDQEQLSIDEKAAVSEEIVTTSVEYYGDYSFAGTHNSYSGDERGTVADQLNAGLSFVEFDLWPIHSDNAYKSNWDANERVLTSFEWQGDTYLVNYESEDGQVSIDQFTGDDIDNVFQTNWSAKERVLTTLQLGSAASYIVNYRPDNGKVSIDKYSADGLANVYQTSWSAKDRVFISFHTSTAAYLVNYRADNGQISIDEFTGSSLSNVYSSSWSAKERVLTSFEWGGVLYLVNYSSESGQISIDKFDGSSLTNQYQTEWDAEDREISAFVLDSIPYLFNYKKSGGELAINGFDGGDLYVVYAQDWANGSRVFTTCDYSGSPYLVNYKSDNGQISIDQYKTEFVLGHDYPGDEVATGDGNPESALLEDWVDIIAEKMNASDYHGYPIVLMLELKKYKPWIQNDLWDIMLQEVEDVLSDGNYCYMGSAAKPNGVGRNTPLDSVKNKVIIYLEPNSDVDDSGTSLESFRDDRLYHSYDWSDYDNKVDELIEKIEDKADDGVLVRVFELQENTSYGDLSTMGDLLNYAVSDDPYDEDFIDLLEDLGAVPNWD